MEIKSSTSLRNQYSEISNYCKKTGKPVYLTKNGEGDLVVMSIEAYESTMRIAQLAKELYEIEIERLNGKNFVSLEEALQKWKEAIKK